MTSRYTIRTLLSALVYSVSALLGVLVYVYSTHHTVNYMVLQQTERGQLEAIQFGRWIENELMQGESVSEEFRIMAMTTLPDEGQATLLDGTGKRFEQLGSGSGVEAPLAGVAGLADLRVKALQERRTQTLYDKASQQLYFLQPFTLPPEPGQLRGLKQGLLLLQYDLAPRLAASAQQILSTAVALTAFLALLSIGLVRFFSRLVTNRLEKLVIFARVNRPLTDKSPLNTTSLDEIEELAASFEALVEKLKQEQAAAHQLALQKNVRQLTHQLPQVVFQLESIPNQQRRFTFLSERMQDLMGMDPKLLQANAVFTASRLLPEDMSTISTQLDQARNTSSGLNFDFRWKMAEEDIRWFHCSAAAESIPGGGVLWTGYFQDITDQKKHEAMLVEARLTAEEADRSKSAFLASVSHEVRTPMNAIIGLTHLTLLTELSHRQRDYLTKIQSASRTLLQLINDLLDFSKIEANRLELDETEFELQEVLTSVITMTTQRASDKGLELRLSPEAIQHLWLKGDMLRLSQILMNLVTNAIKFTQQGFVEISVHELTRAGGRIRLQFSIRDTGIGIPLEHRSRLFKPFSQADGSTTRKFGGTGLGLSICKRLVELMQGQIWLESVPGEGSTFYFTAEFDAPELAVHPPTSAQTVANTLTVLVVEDNTSSRRMFEQLLTNADLRVETASNAEEALRLLRQPQHPLPEIMLIDWQMPGMDGLQLVEQVQKLLNGRPQPTIVMMTAFDDVALSGQCQKLPIHSILHKPIRHQELLSVILSIKSAADMVPQPPPIPATPSWRNRHVLLAEDNDLNQQIMGELLHDVGLELDIANNGQEAVKMVLQSLDQRPYDLVLMDIQMPVMDGLSAVREIRLDERAAQLPIIALTANARSEERTSSLLAGMNDHITKPIEPDAFFEVLKRYLTPTRVPGRGSRPITSPGLSLKGGESGSAETGREIPVISAGHNARTPRGSNPRPPLPQLFANIRDLDSTAGLSRSNQNAELYRDQLLRFAQEYANITIRMEAALRLNDVAAVQQLAHRLAGVAGNLGAFAVEKQAKRLELEAEVTTPQLRLSFITELSVALSQLIAGIRQSLASSKGPVPVSSPRSTGPNLEGVLARLQQYAKECDGEAVEYFHSVEHSLRHEFSSDVVDMLQQLLQNYDFDAALRVISQMKRSRSVSPEENAT